MNDHIHTAGNVVAGAVTVATFLKWLPPVAAAFSIVWVGMNIYTWLRDKKWKKGN